MMDLVGLFHVVEAGYRRGFFGVRETADGNAELVMCERLPQGPTLRRDVVMDRDGRTTNATRVVSGNM